MTRKLARLVLSTTVLLALCMACNADLFGPSARVSCDGVGDAYECSVEHTGGGSGQICWDILATCANGTASSARSCVEITPGQTVPQRVPVSDFSNFAACDRVADLQIVDRTGQ